MDGIVDWDKFRAISDSKIQRPIINTEIEIVLQINTYTDYIVDSVKIASTKKKHKFHRNYLLTPHYTVD